MKDFSCQPIPENYGRFHVTSLSVLAYCTIRIKAWPMPCAT
jgi:hypothetical protein